MIELILAIAFVVLVLLIFALNLEEDDHAILKLIFFLMIFSFLYLLVKAPLDDTCQPVVINASTDGTITNYTYTAYCYSESSSNTDQSFYRLYLWLFRIFWVYVVLWFFYNITHLWDTAKTGYKKMKRRSK